MEYADATNGWINTIDADNLEIIAKAHQIMANNIYCTLSTCSKDSYPWVSPVFFAYDRTWNIYWSSAIVAKHSQNLYKNNGRVAIAIFNSNVLEATGEGLYLYGYASELEPEDTEKIMQLLLNRARRKLNRTAADYLDNSPRRIYQFQPEEVWITGERLAVGNQLIDTKIQLNLHLFRGMGSS